ncbi:MAG: PA0069 family radical SAM protein [Calditrichaeota bacterium]|nr:MAG: PA0069 family radical SAM protein [Calditrichota bacterium]
MSDSGPIPIENSGRQTCSSGLRGRGANNNPANRFEPLYVEPDPEDLARWRECGVRTEYFIDHTRDILARNDSPDLPFEYSLNPYRGCEHGCIYCYARPTHEYLGFSAGLDFESRILVKPDAAKLLAQRLRSPRWRPQSVVFSGNTDCYQPVEKQLRLTRACLKVFLQFRNPVSVITKSALVLRDLDILRELARLNLVYVTLSVTTLDPELSRKMEPRASTPAKRLDALEKLARAGVPTNVNIAPLIPGLNEHEVPAILREAAARGVTSAAYILLRLPWGVKELFAEWLANVYPHRAGKVLHTVEETRAGRLNDPCFGTRLRGEGTRAEAIARMFELSCRKVGLTQKKFALSTEHFRRGDLRQGELF